MANYTCGDGKTYATIQAGIDAIPGNLSGHGKEHVQVYAKAAGYAETLDLNTGFTNATEDIDYIDVEAMVSHRGLRGQGIVVDVGNVAGGLYTGFICCNESQKIHGFCITASTWKAASVNRVFLINTKTRIYDNIIYDCNSDAGQFIDAIYIYPTAGYNKNKIYNNQIINIGSVSGSGVGVRVSAHGTAGNEQLIANNSIYNCSDYCISGGAQNYILCHNNYATNFTGLNGSNCSITYNISSDATADDWGGAGNLINKAAANQFVSVTAGSEILYPKRGSVLLRNGADMSAYLTRDCLGLARVYEDEPYFTTGAIHVPPARVVANLTNRRGNLRPNCYHETI